MKPDQSNPETPTGLRHRWQVSRLLSEGRSMGRHALAMAARGGRLQGELMKLGEQLQGREPTPKEARRVADLTAEFEHLSAEYTRMVARHDILAAELTALGVPTPSFATFERN